MIFHYKISAISPLTNSSTTGFTAILCYHTFWQFKKPVAPMAQGFQYISGSLPLCYFCENSHELGRRSSIPYLDRDLDPPPPIFISNFYHSFPNISGIGDNFCFHCEVVVLYLYKSCCPLRILLCLLLAQMYELSIRHYPLPECCYYVFIHTHVLPFRQQSVGYKYKASCFR